MPFQDLPALRTEPPNMQNAFAVAAKMRDRNEAREQVAKVKGLRAAYLANPNDKAAANALAVEDQDSPLFERQKAEAQMQLQETAKDILTLDGAADPMAALQQLGGALPGMTLEQSLQYAQNPGLRKMAINRARTLSEIAASAIDARDFQQRVLQFQLTQDETERNNRFGNKIAAQNAATSQSSAALARERFNREKWVAMQGKIPDGMRFNANGQLERIPYAPGQQVTPQNAPLDKEQFKFANDLRDEFNRELNTFEERADAFQRTKEAAALGTGAGDLALINSFQKMIDPGGVVREADVDMAMSTAGATESAKAFYAKMLNGEAVTPVQRQAFVSAAEKFFAIKEQQFDGAYKRYEALATRMGLPLDAVIYDPRPKRTPPARQPQQRPMPRAGSPGVVLDRFPPAGRGAPGPIPGIEIAPPGRQADRSYDLNGNRIR